MHAAGGLMLGGHPTPYLALLPQPAPVDAMVEGVLGPAACRQEAGGVGSTG